MAAEDYMNLWEVGDEDEDFGREEGHDDPKRQRGVVVAEAVIVTQTAKAYRFNFGYGHECWLPKSQIKVVAAGNGIYEVTIPEWLADQHEIAGDDTKQNTPAVEAKPVATVTPSLNNADDDDDDDIPF